ncbi:MAG: hypothetical protein FWH55_14555 [Oscillospiraceae bacterium]|nr:hypothetical protein [Oscillospiraceae bacterium]
MTPKENYLRMMRGEIPEFVPAALIEPHSQMVEDELLTPRAAPDGPIVTSLGVTYVGAGEDLMFGAMPAPNSVIIDDIQNGATSSKSRMCHTVIGKATIKT